MKVCKNTNCQLEFSSENTRQLYCSDLCYKRSKALRSYSKNKHNYYGTAQCEMCDLPFLKGRKSAKYCSIVCAGKAKRKFLSIPDAIAGGSRKLDKTLGYVRVYCPMHPEANTWGYVYEHRVVAEQIIGRRLLKDEIVHHKNGIRWDNSPENLEVMDKREHGKLNAFGGQRP